jgi:hypothetical protein
MLEWLDGTGKTLGVVQIIIEKLIEIKFSGFKRK